MLGEPSSGVVRLSDDEYGILVYPCLRFSVARVELVFHDTAGFQTVLRETFASPKRGSDLMVRTGLHSRPAFGDATREVMTPDLLVRFNEDPSFATTFSPDVFFALRAFTPDELDIGGATTDGLLRRFEVSTGQLAFTGLNPVAPRAVRCRGSSKPAWTVS